MDVKVKLPENPVAITDLAEIEKAKALPDWNCDYCQGDNDDPDKFCTNCGAERGSKVRTVKEYTESEVPRGKERLSEADEYAIPQTMFSEVQEKPSAPAANISPFPAKKDHSLRNFSLFFLGVAAILIWLGYFLFSTKEISLTVAETTWERIVYIEESKEVVEEDWDVPSHASVIKSWRAVHHEEDVFDHYNPVKVSYQKQTGTKDRVCGKTDLGTGYFKDKICKDPVYETRYRTEKEKVYRKEPVYQTKYRFKIDRWFDVKSPPRSAGQGKSPHWPHFKLARNQRERTRSEVYTVAFRDKTGKLYSKPQTFEDWKKYQVGKAVQARINMLGMISHLNE